MEMEGFVPEPPFLVKVLSIECFISTSTIKVGDTVMINHADGCIMAPDEGSGEWGRLGVAYALYEEEL